MNNRELQLVAGIQRRQFLVLGGVAGSIIVGGSAANAWEEKPPRLLVHTETPRNSEPLLEDLVQSWITPNERFYVRSHAPVPKVDLSSFRLQVSGMVHKPLEISLGQLKGDFKKQSVVATMTCAGNRRSEHSLVKQISGVPWQAGAIGNASWGGARLSDLLKKAGVKDGAKHVWFEGIDEIERKSGVIPFGASIPLTKAMGDRAKMPGALVCYEMNGQRLTPDHGFPMRTVVPGFIGARSVKWLGKIVVSDRPSPNHYVATAYKLVREGTADEWSAASPLESFPINSVTCLPGPNEKVKTGTIEVSGYALAPGMPGRTVRTVELSADGGKTWTKAEFDRVAQPFCWRLWKGRVSIKSDTTEIITRATDSTGQSQPATVAWNLKGYMFNAWHRVRLNVDQG